MNVVWIKVGHFMDMVWIKVGHFIPRDTKVQGLSIRCIIIYYFCVWFILYLDNKGNYFKHLIIVLF